MRLLGLAAMAALMASAMMAQAPAPEPAKPKLRRPDLNCLGEFVCENNRDYSQFLSDEQKAAAEKQ
jgi:hypothetical protein